MAKTITLTNVLVNRLTVDYINQFVQVDADLVDAAGRVWERKLCTFWVTIPPAPPEGMPAEWFQLPGGYLPGLMQLQSDAKAALVSRFL